MFLLTLYFTPSTGIYHSISYLTRLVFIPLFTFNFNSFLHLQSPQIIHLFFSLFEGMVASIPNAIQAAFHTFHKENFSSSFRLLPIFKILGLLIQILSKSTVKQFTIFCFCCQKSSLTLEFSY